MKSYRRWTKYSNPGQIFHSATPHPNLNVEIWGTAVFILGVWFVLSTRPMSPNRFATLKFGGQGVKDLSEGLNILSIYGRSINSKTSIFSLTATHAGTEEIFLLHQTNLWRLDAFLPSKVLPDCLQNKRRISCQNRHDPVQKHLKLETQTTAHKIAEKTPDHPFMQPKSL